MNQVYAQMASYKSGDARSMAKALEALTPGLIRTAYALGLEPSKVEWIIKGPEEKAYWMDPLSGQSKNERMMEILGHDTMIAWKARFDIPEPLRDYEEPEILVAP
jgi:hypothetical protein